MSTRLVGLCVFLALVPAHAQEGVSRPESAARTRAPTCRRDQTGVEWVLPFEAARAKARAERRLLFLKPIAFGTTADGGW